MPVLTPFRRDGDRPFGGQELTSEARFGSRNGVQGPLSDDLTSAHARTRTEIDNVIGSTHRLFVVLDHNHRVALIAQVAQAVQQHAVVTRMKANGGLIQNIDHAHQPTADLSGKPNALALTARQSGRGSVEC